MRPFCREGNGQEADRLAGKLDGGEALPARQRALERGGVIRRGRFVGDDGAALGVQDPGAEQVEWVILAAGRRPARRTPRAGLPGPAASTRRWMLLPKRARPRSTDAISVALQRVVQRHAQPGQHQRQDADVPERQPEADGGA